MAASLYDNDNFEIKNGNQLYVKNAYNYEVDKKKVKVRLMLTSTDGLTTLYKDLELSITDANDAPIDILIPVNRFAIGLPVATIISPLVAIDEDVSDRDFNIELIDNSTLDNVEFAINSNILKSAKVFKVSDVGAKNVRVKVTDPQGAFFTKDLTIQIYDPNENNEENTAGPSGIGFDNMLLNLGASANSKVCKLFVEDIDGGTDYTYSLVEDANTQNEYFKIVGKQLQLAKKLDENVSNYSIHIRVDDGDYTYDGTYLFYACTSSTAIEPSSQLKSASRLYPNPCNNEFEVEIKNDHIGEVVFEIYSTSSKLQQRTVVNKFNTNHKATIDCSNIASGLYILRIKSGSEIETIKFRKK